MLGSSPGCGPRLRAPSPVPKLWPPVRSSFRGRVQLGRTVFPGTAPHLFAAGLVALGAPSCQNKPVTQRRSAKRGPRSRSRVHTFDWPAAAPGGPSPLRLGRTAVPGGVQCAPGPATWASAASEPVFRRPAVGSPMAPSAVRAPGAGRP